MNDSMAHPGEGLASLELPGWKTASSWTSALLLALLFLVSGLWKVVDPLGWSQRISQLNVPQSLSLAAALAFGIAETLGAVLIIVPRFRRWGAILVGALLLAFMAYFALNYNLLRGAECSCFPWVKRVVGPEFFMGDGLMLLLALCAGVWSKPSGSLRSALVIAGVVTVFAFVSYGVEAVRQTGTRSPDTNEPVTSILSFGPIAMVDSPCASLPMTTSPLAVGSSRTVRRPRSTQQFESQTAVRMRCPGSSETTMALSQP